MPLNKSGSKASVGKNIKTEMVEGKKPRKQAIAIALETRRRALSDPGEKLKKMTKKKHDKKKAQPKMTPKIVSSAPSDVEYE